MFLIGFMASGKTTVGRIVARRLGWRFADVDQVIAAAAGRPVPQIFADEGESGFRRREAEALRSVAGSRGMIIATGGGAACADANLALMLASGRVVALAVTAADALARAGTGRGRPVLGAATAQSAGDPVEGVAALLAAREPFYARAHHRIDTAGKSPDGVAAEVLELLEADPP